MEIKSFIKTKLNILLEAKIDGHFFDRLKQRILETHDVTVGYEIQGTVGEYKKVGLFQIPPEVKQQVLDVYNSIVKTNFPKQKHFGIKMAELRIEPSKVNFYDGFDMSELKGKTLVIVDDVTKSNGNIIYAIVRYNEAITLFYAKSYANIDANRMNVDVVIKNMANYRPQ